MNAYGGRISNDTRRAIRSMCAVISDDTRIAAIHGVSVDQVTEIRETAKRRKPELVYFCERATGSDIRDLTYTERMTKEGATRGSQAMLKRMIETGHHWLSPERLTAVCDQHGWNHGGTNAP